MKKKIFLLLIIVSFLIFGRFVNTKAYSIEVNDSDKVTEIDVDHLYYSFKDGNHYFTIDTLNLKIKYSGKAYSVFDDEVLKNKIFIINSELKTNIDNVYIMNFLLEFNAKKDDLSGKKQYLDGKDVIKIALYINNNKYYFEDIITFDVSNLLANNNKISKKEQNNILDQIFEFNSWYMYSDEEPTLQDNTIKKETKSTKTEPLMGDNLTDLEKHVIQEIGVSYFTSECFIYGFTRSLDNDGNYTIDGGYLLRTVNNPVTTNNMVSHLIFFSIVTITPTENSGQTEIGYATLRITLEIVDEFRYIESTNTISNFAGNVTYRLYDLKLAIECAKYDSDTYDYIYKRGIYKNQTNLQSGKIALTIAKQFDKYGIISFTEDIFDSFSEDDSGDNIAVDEWPADFNLHYSYASNSKSVNTIVRGVRVDTDDVFNTVGDVLHLSAWIADRDYSDSTTNILKNKAIKYVIKYELRTGGTFGFLFGGDVVGEYGKEFYRIYKR